MMILPDNFIRTITDVHGVTGEKWLGQLPSLLADIAQQWALTVEDSHIALSYNYVTPARRADGTRVMLKVGVPTGEMLSEIEALSHYNGQSIARLLEVDAEKGALLLERLEPGTPLTALVTETDEQATSIAASVMRQLWRPLPREHSFLSVADWGAGLHRMRTHFGGSSGPFPAALVDEAERLFTELLSSMGEPVLLHGDLHHDNILQAERERWLAIDPKGIVGEPAYEVGSLLRNPLPQLLQMTEPRRVMARRVDILADELEIDRARIRGWGLAQAVLSAWWTVEDHGTDWEDTIACAELLRAIQV